MEHTGWDIGLVKPSRSITRVDSSTQEARLEIKVQHVVGAQGIMHGMAQACAHLPAESGPSSTGSAALPREGLHGKESEGKSQPALGAEYDPNIANPQGWEEISHSYTLLGLEYKYVQVWECLFPKESSELSALLPMVIYFHHRFLSFTARRCELHPDCASPFSSSK